METFPYQTMKKGNISRSSLYPLEVSYPMRIQDDIFFDKALLQLAVIGSLKHAYLLTVSNNHWFHLLCLCFQKMDS